MTSRTPTNEREVRALLADRPNLWEYFYFAAILRDGITTTETKYRDHELRFPARSETRVVDDAEAAAYLSRAMDDVLANIATLMEMFDQRVLISAFGAPGEAGDADRIRHVAQRMTSVHESMLDWAAGVRGVSRGDRYRRWFELVAQLADRPVEEYRAFVSRLVEQVDKLTELAARPGSTPIRVQMTLSLSADDALIAEIEAEVGRRFASEAADE